MIPYHINNFDQFEDSKKTYGPSRFWFNELMWEFCHGLPL